MEEGKDKPEAEQENGAEAHDVLGEREDEDVIF